MKDERMKVLEMLEKQVITAEEAQRLLELLTKPVKGETRERAMEAASCFSEDFTEKAVAFNDKLEAFAKESAQKLEAMAKDVEPKFKKATQIIIEKTVSMVDEVSKAFHEEHCQCSEKEKCNNCEESKNDEPKEDEPKEN